MDKKTKYLNAAKTLLAMPIKNGCSCRLAKVFSLSQLKLQTLQLEGQQTIHSPLFS
jgi:hypothetical protein